MSHDAIALASAELAGKQAAGDRNRLRLDIAARVAGAVYHSIDGNVSIGKAVETAATVSMMIADTLIERSQQPPAKWSKDDDQPEEA